MLYMDDYLEMIEHLPLELRDRFTEIRDNDSTVQSSVDQLSRDEKLFFEECRILKQRGMNDGAIQEKQSRNYQNISGKYQKVLQLASEKVQLADDSYNLVDRYLRKLDVEVHKFKMELEADNRGITQILEKRSFELDASSKSDSSQEDPSLSASQTADLLAYGLSLRSVAPHNNTSSISDDETVMSDLSSRYADDDWPPPSSSMRGDHGCGSDFASSASYHHLTSLEGSRRASNDSIGWSGASNRYVGGDTIDGGGGGTSSTSNVHEYSLNAVTSSGGVGQKGEKVGKKRSKDKRSAHKSIDSKAGLDMSHDSLNSSSAVNQMGGGGGDTSLGSGTSGVSGGRGGGAGGSSDDWNLDPNEPTYCICNQVSYGDMVACDNDHCPYEWFHYPCVGVTSPPKGKWYCPTCSARRKSRK